MKMHASEQIFHLCARSNFASGLFGQCAEPVEHTSFCRASIIFFLVIQAGKGYGTFERPFENKACAALK